jgi:hypothetical protein
MKKTLDLWSVQIHRCDVANTNDLQKIGNHPSDDRLPPALSLVRTSIPEGGHDRRDARGACAAAGICEGEELDQVIVDRRRGRLHEEDLLAAHGIDKLYGNLAVGIRSSIQAPT